MIGSQLEFAEIEVRIRENVASQGYMSLVGAEIVALGRGQCKLGVNRRAELLQQHGYFHGGVTAFLIDNATTIAAAAASGHAALTAEYKLNLLSPAVGERLICHAQVIKAGRQLSVVAADVFCISDGMEKRTATALATIAMLSDPSPSLVASSKDTIPYSSRDESRRIGAPIPLCNTNVPSTSTAKYLMAPMVAKASLLIRGMDDFPGAGMRISGGMAFLAVASLGWGFNWPVSKYLLGELPPLTTRGTTGVIGAALLAVFALLRGQSLKVPPETWPRLALGGLLNITSWMVLMGLALLWLPASETALIAYTMPVWVSIISWPVLGERPTVPRAIAILMALAGLAAIMEVNGITASGAKLPGILMALGGAIAFALGTVLAKKWPVDLKPLPVAIWQIGLGCFPVAIIGLCVETTNLHMVSPLGWILLCYTVMQFCLVYVCWFAALARLPAPVAAIGTMAVPVIGVATSAIALHEPLGSGQVIALGFTLAGVVLAMWS